MARDEEEIKKVLLLIGARLKEVRKEKGFSNYEKFAFLNDVSRSNYSGYENGGNMQIKTLIHILASLNISLKEFFEVFDELPTKNNSASF